jgi:hypothetical protein
VQRTTFYEEGIDHDTLLSRKSLTRSEIEDLLARACGRPRSFVEDWDIIRTDLESRGMGSVAQIKLKTSAISFIRDRNSGRGNAGKLSGFASGWIANNKASVEACDSILEIADLIQAKITDSYGYSADVLKAASIVEAYEAINAAK